VNAAAWAGVITAATGMVTATTTGIVALIKAIDAGRKADAHAAAPHGAAHPYPPVEAP